MTSSSDPSQEGAPDGESSEDRVEVSKIDDKDRHDILVQQIIDDLVRTSGDRPHPEVAAELADRIAAENLPARPQPWLDAVAAEVIAGNAYVVSATTATVSDVPQPDMDRSGEALE
ncbi:MAG: hypothetical protein ABI112_13655 [Terracoccus sp.]